MSFFSRIFCCCDDSNVEEEDFLYKKESYFPMDDLYNKYDEEPGILVVDDIINISNTY